MPETAHKYVLAEIVFNLYALTMPETAQKYELSFLRACRKSDFSGICNDMGIIQVINVDWNTMCVSSFRNI